MDSSLEHLRRELKSAIETAKESDGKPCPTGKWNASQILEHLLLTYRNTNRALAKCVESGKPLATSPTLRHRVGTILVVNLGYLPGGRKSPERVVPQGMPAHEVREAILAELDSMEKALANCEGEFGSRTKLLDHPFLGPLTAQQWRRFHWIHGRHHVRQLRERATG